MAFPILGFLFLFPLTMAYVIVVHRAMDVRVVVRQGVQYVLAAAASAAIQLALIVGVSIAGRLDAVRRRGDRAHRDRGRGSGGIVAIGGRFADRLRGGWTGASSARPTTPSRSSASSRCRCARWSRRGRCCETVAQRIAETLHVPRVAILLNEGGRLQPAYAVGYATLPHVAIPEESVTVRRLQRDPHTRASASTIRIRGCTTCREERAAIARGTASRVLLPLSLNQKLLGVMSLGPKRSEEPYSTSDLRLLGSVATQTGLALENSRLTAEIAAQIAEREKRQRELEIAREVQQRLFPQECPPVPGLEYAGACRPALDVGGDYYDFLPLSPTGSASRSAMCRARASRRRC